MNKEVLLNDPVRTIPDDRFKTPICSVAGLKRNFENFEAAMKHIANTEGLKKTNAELKSALDNLFQNVYGERPTYDTSLGGNVAINPRWGFDRNDDIVHPLGSIGSSNPQIGMGRVYHDMYHTNQQVIHLMFGSARYYGLAKFLRYSANAPLSRMMRGEDGVTIGTIMKGVLTKTGEFLIELPWMPLYGLVRLTRITNEWDVGKYVRFVPNMSTYYRIVNTMLHTLAAGMGLGVIPDVLEKIAENDNAAKMRKMYGLTENSPTEDPELDAYRRPRIIREGLDIITILNRRHRLRNPDFKTLLRLSDIDGVASKEKVDKDNNPILDEDGLVQYEASKDGLGEFNLGNQYREMIRGALNPSGFSSTFKNAFTSGYHYVTFRIDKTDNASESFSNQVGPSDAANRLNSASQQGIETNFGRQGMKTGIESIDQVTDRLLEWGRSLADTVTFGFFSGQLESKLGSGFYDIPEIWKGSSFSKSYTFNFNLRSPYGDPASIMQAIYVPLVMLLAGALPRGVGSSMYTTPFLLRAYCKGQFAIPLGIIESISITRGASEFGWTQNYLPTAVDVSVSIRDLNPVLFLGVSDLPGKLSKIFSGNTNFAEYLTTLSGVGFNERYFTLPRIARSLAIFYNTQRTSLFSSAYWAQKIASGNLVQSVASFVPPNEWGTND